MLYLRVARLVRAHITLAVNYLMPWDTLMLSCCFGQDCQSSINTTSVKNHRVDSIRLPLEELMKINVDASMRITKRTTSIVYVMKDNHANINMAKGLWVWDCSIWGSWMLGCMGGNCYDAEEYLKGYNWNWFLVGCKCCCERLVYQRKSLNMWRILKFLHLLEV